MILLIYKYLYSFFAEFIMDDNLDISIDDSYSEDDYVLDSAEDNILRVNVSKSQKESLIYDHMKTNENSSMLDSTMDEDQNLTAECSTSNKSPQIKSKITIKYLSREDGDESEFFEKRQCCFYCFKFYAVIIKHYYICHSTEEKIQEIKKHPPGRFKDMLMEKMINLGNYKHNMKVLKKKSGNLMVVRKPTGIASHDKYLPCNYCLGFFTEDELHQHTPRCKFNEMKDDSSSEISERDMVLMASNREPTVLAATSHDEISENNSLKMLKTGKFMIKLKFFVF